MIKLSAKEENFFNDVIYETLQLNDYDLQCFVACEELAELIQAISKAERFSSHDILGNYYEFIEEQLTGEIADVYIVLEQLQYMFGISNENIQAGIDTKLKRQHARNEQFKTRMWCYGRSKMDQDYH